MDLGHTRHITEQENANYHDCIENAKRHGYTVEEAEHCEIGYELCPDCPFIKEHPDIRNASDADYLRKYDD